MRLRQLLIMQSKQSLLLETNNYFSLRIKDEEIIHKFFISIKALFECRINFLVDLCLNTLYVMRLVGYKS